MNKFGFVIYRCFICNFIEHKIYNYFDKDAAQVMFMKKVVVVIPKKEYVLNMVLVIITHNQIPKNVVFKEKEPFKNKSLDDW